MSFIILIVVILFLLAITDLIVGVSNDAVNFLNSAIGSRVASFRTIILVASAGVILGAIFSSGIMEVARTGIFHPQYFTFEKVMFIFLAVMLTDIVLLDIFNTLGLPTSTTVSIIFELLGASMMAGILFSIEKADPVSDMFKYINAESVITIISGIFLSIVIAFTVGIFVQYLSRLLFSFNYESRLARYGALYAGLGITAIVYFLLIKGLKGTTLLSEQSGEWIKTNTLIILAGLFLLSTLTCLILQKTIKLNPLKAVVLMGTFSLAMAFAGNDLVNFIGVPITGFLAFTNWKSSGLAAGEQYQDYLASANIVVPNYMLLIAGGVMAATLYLSSKAKNVTETEVKLGSQQEADERFQPTAVSRRIVKTSMMLSNFLKLIVPRGLVRAYDLSFEKSKIRQATIIHNKPAFDLVRASANLVIASSIIAVATSMKLPLSTTYVSFMVAMGTSLADKAWGKESAVYRVAGVLSVIGGWFVTAVIAFTVSALFVFILIKGGEAGVFTMVILVALFIIFSYIRFTSTKKKEKTEQSRLILLQESDLDIYEANKKMVVKSLKEVNEHYNRALEALEEFSDEKINKTYKKLEKLEQFSFKMRAQTIRYIKNLQVKDNKSGQILLFSGDLLEDMFSSTGKLVEECHHYINNLHQQPGKDFIKVIVELRFRINAYFQLILNAIDKDIFDNLDVIKVARDDARNYINGELDRRLKIISDVKPGTKQAVLETTILLQSRDILAIALRIFNMYRKYIGAGKSQTK